MPDDDEKPKHPDLTTTGSVTFWLRAANPGAFTDASVGRFAPWSGHGIRVEVAKNPDATASVVIEGPHTKTYRMSAKIPPCDDRGLFVAITSRGMTRCCAIDKAACCSRSARPLSTKRSRIARARVSRSGSG